MKTIKYLALVFIITMSNLCVQAQNSLINEITTLDSSSNSIRYGRQSLICDNSGTFHLFYVLHGNVADYLIMRSSIDNGSNWSTSDTISVHPLTSASSRYLALAPTATIDEQNNIHILYEYRGLPVYNSSWQDYPPSHMNYVTNVTGNWITDVNIINDSAIQASQGNGATVSYLNNSQIINYNEHQHYIGYDYAWWATKYNVVYSNNINGNWLHGSALHTFDLGTYDNIMINAPSMVLNNDSLFSLWYQRSDCRVEMKSFSGVDWSPLNILYNDVLFPTPSPTSYNVRVGSCFNNDEAKIAMFRTPEENFNELLLLNKSKNQSWKTDTMMFNYTYSMVRPAIVKDTTYIFLIYSNNDENGSSLVKYTNSQGFVSNLPLATSGDEKIYNLIPSDNSVNPIAYMVYDALESMYYLKIGKIENIISSISPIIPNYLGVKLYQNYPNPFLMSTKISYSIAERSKVKIEVFNLLGESVKILVDEHKNPGKHTLDFNAANLTEGIYYYNINSQGCSKTKKMILLK